MTSEQGRVAGKVAIVTGGASGIGHSCALRLAGEGASVMVTDIQDDAGAETVAAIQDKGGVAEFLHRDVTSESDWQAVVAATMASMGGVHVLVDNASISIGGSGSAITMSSVAA